MNVEREGILRLLVDVKVDVNEMRDWSPERITQFMDGLAKVQAAANPNNWDDNTATKPTTAQVRG